MSLVGNLEDLSLGDILQIISLSHKSGVLSLASDLGSGRIVFRNGLVQAARLKGEPNDLRELLVRHALLDPAGYDASLARAEGLGVPIEETLAADAGITRERIETLIQEAAETTILEMFSWPSGDFSFDVRTELEPDDPHLILAAGLNAQYLAMEGLRLRDERAREVEAGAPVDEVVAPASAEPAFEASADGMFADPSIDSEADPLFGTPVDAVADAPVDAVADAPVDASADAPVDAVADAPVAVADPAASSEPADLVAARAVERADPLPAPETTRDDATAAPALPAAIRTATLPVVLIDPDVAALGWVKGAIEEDFARVHVFQQAEQGLARIRQYLIRGEAPLVLIAPDAPVDPLSGIQGIADFVKRLKAQSPRLRVIALRVADGNGPAVPGVFDGVVDRPARHQLVDRAEAEGAAAAAALLRQLIDQLAPGGSAPGGTAPADPKPATDAPAGAAAGEPAKPAVSEAADASLRQLRDVTAQLQAASSRGEILPVVLDYAAGLFERVAILVVRDGNVFAVAGRGFASLEVDPLDPSPPISFELPDAGRFRRAIEARVAQTGPASDPADQAVLARLGGEGAPESYFGPIESAEVVIGVLYGDQGTSGRPLPDPHGLEVVLHHAGLALDRAALERALWEVDADG